MAVDGYFLDSALLVLLVAGATDPRIIDTHRRLEGYSRADYETLIVLIESVRGVVYATPNTFSEASNLVRLHGEPQRELLTATLGRLINAYHEVVVHSKEAANAHAFLQLGLTDAALLTVISERTPLVTDDWDLYEHAMRDGDQRAVWFPAFRTGA